MRYLHGTAWRNEKSWNHSRRFIGNHSFGGMQIPWRKSGSLSCKMAYHPWKWAQGKSCICRLSAWFLSSEGEGSAFWFRRSQGNYSGVCPWYRSLSSGWCCKLQPDLFSVRQRESYVTGRSLSGSEAYHCRCWWKGQTNHRYHAVPLWKQTA